jgi:hypothetical protein
VRIVLCVGLLLAFSRIASGQEPSTQPEPVLETGELMLLVIKPAYDELKQAMSAPPVDRQQWAALYQKAARLAEFENLILFRPHERSDKPEWKTLATNARKASVAVASAAMKALAKPDEASADTLKKAYEEVSSRCNACHRAMSREAPTIKPD